MPNLVTMLVSLERAVAGMHRKSLQVGDHKVFYAEGGKGDPMVLVHGFNSSADCWNSMAGRLGKHYRLLAPDLPGWGESTRLQDTSYGYNLQIDRLHQFLQQLGLTRFHLIGHSMGGFISAAYAARYPDEVRTLCLMAPHGITEPVRSYLAECVDRGDNWLVPATVKDFGKLLDNVFGKRPYIPGPLIKFLAAQTIGRAAKSARIFDEIQVGDPPLEQRLDQIKAPTLIIWGDQDKLIHVSAAEIFHKAISGSKLLILNGTGHMPMMENARQCTETLLAFIKRPQEAAEAAA